MPSEFLGVVLMFVVSDQVSDAILDACMAEDPLSKVRIADHHVRGLCS